MDSHDHHHNETNHNSTSANSTTTLANSTSAVAIDSDGHSSSASAAECSALVSGYYDLPLHIASIFIVMSVSVVGALIPFFFKRFMSSKNGALFQQCLKVFGAGIIISTAAIHMLPPAAEALLSPCAGEEIHKYHGFFGALILFGILTTHLAQVILTDSTSSTHDHSHGHGHHHHHHHHVHEDHCLADHESGDTNSTDGDKNASVVVPSPTPSSGKQHLPVVSNDATPAHPIVMKSLSNATAVSTITLPSPEQHHPKANKNLVSLFLLEIGIAIHSVIIGVTLGTATNEFKSLLIAISFHQFFEGMALASILLDTKSSSPSSTTTTPTTEKKKKSFMSIGLVLFYGLSTAIGIAVGIAIHESFAPDAQRSLLSQGMLEAISGGILLYEGLVNIITPHFASRSYTSASHGVKTLHVGMIWLGCCVMAVVGIWA